MGKIKRILDSYINGTFSASTQAAFRQWLLSSRENEELDNDLSNLWENLSYTVSSSRRSSNQDLRDIHRRLGWRDYGMFIPRWAIVAGVAAILTLFVSEYYFLTKREKEIVSVRTCLAAPESGKAFYLLPDGTHVWLNSGSVLSYVNKSFSDKVRTVSLSGEAFFDVVKDESKPFIVQMDDIDIRVLGTQFNVRTPLFFDNYEISLQSGKVQILGLSRDVILLPGQQCILSKSSGQVVVRKTDVSNCSSWFSESLRFDNQTLGDILINLEHWYNMRVITSDQVDLSKRLSFTLKPESLDNTLNLLGKLTGYSFDTSENQIIKVNTIN